MGERQLPAPVTTGDELLLVVVEELRETRRLLSQLLGSSTPQPEAAPAPTSAPTPAPSPVKRAARKTTASTKHTN